jgi:predicted SnoaL-like aldol condensation-catalyzing enzyme
MLTRTNLHTIGMQKHSSHDVAVSDPGPAAWVERFAAFWRSPTPEGCIELMHPEARSFYPGMDVPQDRDGIVAWFRTTLGMMPDLRLQVLRWAATGDAVMIEWRASATIRDLAATWDGVDRFRLRGDQAIEGRVYFDTMRVFGGTPPTRVVE